MKTNTRSVHDDAVLKFSAEADDRAVDTARPAFLLNLRLPRTIGGMAALAMTLLGVALMLMGMAQRILSEPAAHPSTRTGAMATAAIIPSATIAPVVAAAPNATSAPVTTQAGIAVGFTPDQLDHVLAPDAPVTWLSAVQERAGDRLCYIGVPYASSSGSTAQAQLWARCADVGLNPPAATPAPTQPPVVQQPVVIPAAPAPTAVPSATARAPYDVGQPVSPTNCPVIYTDRGCTILVVASEGGK